MHQPHHESSSVIFVSILWSLQGKKLHESFSSESICRFPRVSAYQTYGETHSFARLGAKQFLLNDGEFEVIIGAICWNYVKSSPPLPMGTVINIFGSFRGFAGYGQNHMNSDCIRPTTVSVWIFIFTPLWSQAQLPHMSVSLAWNLLHIHTCNLLYIWRLKTTRIHGPADSSILSSPSPICRPILILLPQFRERVVTVAGKHFISLCVFFCTETANPHL